MNPAADAADEAIEGAIALLEAVTREASPARLSGARFLARVPRLEQLGRLIDGLRAVHAADASERMMGPVDTLGAAGYASARDAVAQLAGVSEAEAARRIRLGERISSGLSLSGAPVAPRFPAVADAVLDGELGVEAAEIITRELGGVALRVDSGVIHEAEAGLVELARGSHSRPPLRAELVREQVALYLLAIDPDGAEPTERTARMRRRLTFGRETPEGMIPVTGMLVAEVGAQFKRLVEAHRRKVAFGADATGPGDDGEAAGAQAEGAEAAGYIVADDRTPAQRRHDTLADILGAAARVKDAPEIAGSAPAVIVTVTKKALDDGGVGFLDDHTTPISAGAVERLVDSRGMQIVTMNESGRVLSLGSVQRCFTSSQRRAIIARDGGCVIPGCTTAAGWCEVHHVVPWREGGETHVDNGVLLCWGHHQRIDSGPWRLSMPDGVPHVRGPGINEWTPAGMSRVRIPLPRTG
ncbi:HNH endonuclease [Labedella gwakjiensis]|uniref:HNH endonuclease n=1 Tax=Labedella gwakjiensis TaxID=390269 RepID=A0A2P8GTL8_9MICO|nr:HNH endonuclease signature motif containing protein [Labedella gwakjiensis]PSL37316.1 HNH endonuclease [Labedella gwakjiensis]RUQ84641.1 HNH endonuclease [Labedella gwakjiensis]